MTFLIKAAQLILSLSLLVIIHEFGHFLFARIFKTRVEKFYLFFNPWFSIFKIKRGETEYGLGWLPIGGYVKISGMIDESMDKEQLKQPPQPYEFRSKPTWQRLLIMLGGILFNLIAGIIIYTFLLFRWGDEYLPNKNITDGIFCLDSIANDIGIQNGDKIISINDESVEKYSSIMEEMLYGGTMIVERNKKNIELQIPKDLLGKLMNDKKKKGKIFLYPRFPFVINEIPDTSINAKSGLKSKDIVTAINNIPVKYYDEVISALDSLRSKEIVLEVVRKDKKESIPVMISDDGKIEIYTIIPDLKDLKILGIYKFETIEYSFFEAIPAGMVKAVATIKSYVRQFKLIFNFKTGAFKAVGSVGVMGSLFAPTWDWYVFWTVTALLSLILAFMNLLPIPALDGGHVLFLLYEIVTGRKPSDKFLEYAQIVGMVIVLLLMAFALGNDISRGIQSWFGK